MSNTNPAFSHKEYLIRKKFWKLFGGAFHVYDTQGNVIFYGKQKAFKLKEDFRIYSDETESRELLKIKTPKILDIAATYYISDSSTDEVIGAVKRKGLKSIVKDEWIFLSKQEQPIGKLKEKSALMALLSRLINLIPQKYIIVTNDGKVLAEFKQHFNIFILKYTLSILDDNPVIDKRLIIAMGILLAGIEGRQQ